jgi:hypothetical protein
MREYRVTEETYLLYMLFGGLKSFKIPSKKHKECYYLVLQGITKVLVRGD